MSKKIQTCRCYSVRTFLIRIGKWPVCSLSVWFFIEIIEIEMDKVRSFFWEDEVTYVIEQNLNKRDIGSWNFLLCLLASFPRFFDFFCIENRFTVLLLQVCHLLPVLFPCLFWLYFVLFLLWFWYLIPHNWGQFYSLRTKRNPVFWGDFFALKLIEKEKAGDWTFRLDDFILKNGFIFNVGMRIITNRQDDFLIKIIRLSCILLMDFCIWIRDSWCFDLLINYLTRLVSTMLGLNTLKCWLWFFTFDPKTVAHVLW